MSNLSLTRVNQKLNQAKMLLQHADEKSLSTIHLNSLLEGACFHLVCAHHHYLRELAETYGLKNLISIGSEKDLINAFEAAKKVAVEAQELMELRHDPMSWLSQLQTYYDSLWRIPVRGEHRDSDDFIQLVDESIAAMPTVNLDLVLSWQVEFASLVGRQRETSAEF